jgi:ferrous iron transport protein B
MGLSYAIAVVFAYCCIVFLLFLHFWRIQAFYQEYRVLMNRGFKLVGLSGKAVIPIMLGLVAAQWQYCPPEFLNQYDKRILATFIIALGIPLFCSAWCSPWNCI